jgi:hypothetical protein
LIAHLRGGCVVCAPLYQEAVAAVTALSASVTLASPSEAVEERLRVYAARGAKVVPMPAVGAATKGHVRARWWQVGIAAALAGVGFLGGWMMPREARTVDRVVERVAERVVEKPVVRDVVREVPVTREVAVVREVPVVREVERVVEKPIERVVERVVEKPVDRVVDRVVERIVDRGPSQELQQELAVAREQLQRSERMIAEYRNVFRALDAGGVRQVELARVDAAAGASTARALYSPQGGLLVFAHGLPKLEGDKCYQVWILRKGTPSIVSGGLLKLDARGDAFLSSPVLNALKDATGFAITDEPAGGSVVAQGKKLLFGAL